MSFDKYNGEPVFKILINLNSFYMTSVPPGNKKEYFCTIRLNKITTLDDWI